MQYLVQSLYVVRALALRELSRKNEMAHIMLNDERRKGAKEKKKLLEVLEFQTR